MAIIRIHPSVTNLFSPQAIICGKVVPVRQTEVIKVLANHSGETDFFFRQDEFF